MLYTKQKWRFSTMGSTHNFPHSMTRRKRANCGGPLLAHRTCCRRESDKTQAPEAILKLPLPHQNSPLEVSQRTHEPINAQLQSGRKKPGQAQRRSKVTPRHAVPLRGSTKSPYESLAFCTTATITTNDTTTTTIICLLYTSPSPRDRQKSRMPSSA